MNHLREYSFLDQCCLGVDQAIRAVFGGAKITNRPYPAENQKECDLTEKERQHIASLMRVNHAGEVCAQALYHGQGLVSRQQEVKDKMQQAAVEEGDHLAWCSKRLMELHSHTSYLNPLWYAGSFAIGLTAGVIGDSWSLGFLAETENQVVKHLEKHLALLPSKDMRSHLILQQMQQDESQHQHDAIAAGGKPLPGIIKKVMRLVSKIMVKTAKWV
jgi:ubiquinone biosynthesis monooxygenase Coq7